MHSYVGLVQQARPLASMLAILLMVLPTAAAAMDADEAGLKAAFIAKIARFVEWPEGSFDSDSAPIRVGVIGHTPFFNVLRDTLAEASAGGRSFELRHLGGLDEASGQHIVVLTETGRAELRSAARALRDMPVLSVGLDFEFAKEGGTIGIELYKGKIAFDANHAAARRSGLRISSRVLKLATNVY